MDVGDLPNARSGLQGALGELASGSFAGHYSEEATNARAASIARSPDEREAEAEPRRDHEEASRRRARLRLRMIIATRFSAKVRTRSTSTVPNSAGCAASTSGDCVAST